MTSAVPSASPAKPNSPGTWHPFLSHPLAVASAAYLLFLVGMIACWPWVSNLRPDEITSQQFQAPSFSHPCGTDVHGRDVLARIVYGARISLLVGAVGALVSLVIGVTWGSLAGYAGGKTDSVLMRAVDILYALPSIVFVIVLITTLEGFFKSSLNRFLGPAAGANVRLIFLFVGLGAVSWLTMARIVRGQVLSLRSRPFVEASRVLGASHFHILRRHIWPNIYGVVIVYLMLTIPAVILYESFLSFLGLGIQPPQASWGSLLSEGALQINPVQIYWWLLVFPGAFLVLSLLALNFVGDGLRSVWDPRSCD